MPLLEMSPNIQESETTNRKRSHDEFSGNEANNQVPGDDKLSLMAASQSTVNSLSTDGEPSLNNSPLVQPGRSTPARTSPSPQTPIKPQATKQPGSSSKPIVIMNPSSQSNSTSTPLVKRKRLTGAAKEARDKELAEQKKEREEAKAAMAAEKAAEKAAKAAEKARIEEEKAARAKEREEAKAKADEEKAAKLKERDEKKRQKEEEQKRIQEEKDKKARSQTKIASFFSIPNTPKKTGKASSKTDFTKDASPAKGTPGATKTEYEKLFKPFFIKENTRIALLGPQMDNETRALKAQILDECISGKRADEVKDGFDAVALLALPCMPPKRGMLHHPVKHIMEQFYKNTERADGTNPNHALEIKQQARRKLSKIPMKSIKFSQDVRPPYYGTITFKTFALGKENMSQLARKPLDRCLPLDYDYDSEAEWQEEEEGEDLEMEDDEEELDDEDDMEEFLDDSEDAGLSRRIFANQMEPESTGICFEGSEPSAHIQTIYEHRMEFMLGGLGQSWGIDPFSTQYWEPEHKSKTAKSSSESGSKMPPPPARTNAFAAMTGGTPAGDAPKMVKAEILDDVKKAILDNAALSKVGIIDFIFHQFRDNVSRMEVKNTLELVAEKKGSGRQKSWALKPGHEIMS